MADIDTKNASKVAGEITALRARQYSQPTDNLIKGVAFVLHRNEVYNYAGLNRHSSGGMVFLIFGESSDRYCKGA